MSGIYQPFFFLHNFIPKKYYESLAHLTVQSGCDKHCTDFLGCSEKQN